MNVTSLEDRIEQHSAGNTVTEAEFREEFSKLFREKFDAIGEPFSGMNPAEVLFLVDPLVYQIELNTWLKVRDLIAVRGKFYPRECVEIDIENELEALRWKIAWLKKHSPEGDEDVTACQVAYVRGQIEDVKNYLPKAETK